MILLTDYRGQTVRLTGECRRHILELPEMVGLEAAIAETLLTPWQVVQSRSDPATELHYRLYISAFRERKIRGNQKRDRAVTRELKRRGWRVLRIGEHALRRQHEARAVARIRRALEMKKS